MSLTDGRVRGRRVHNGGRLDSIKVGRKQGFKLRSPSGTMRELSP